MVDSYNKRMNKIELITEHPIQLSMAAPQSLGLGTFTPHFVAWAPF